MNLLVNEWRKFYRRRGLSLTIPIILLVVTIGLFLITRLFYNPLSSINYGEWFQISLRCNLAILMILAVIYAATTLTQELTSGTIKFSLTRPYNRHKILMAKYGALVILMTVMMLFSAVISLLTEFIFLGHIPSLTFCLKQTGVITLFFLISVMYFGAFSLLLSALINSSAISTALTILFYGMGHAVWSLVALSFLRVSEDNWFLYKLFPLEINNHLNQLFGQIIGNAKFDPSELFITIVTTLVYTLIFYLIADFWFNRKDISLTS